MIQNKYIIRLSFIGLFLNIVANIVLYRYFMIEDIMLKQVTAQNSKVADFFKVRVWDKHPNAIEKLHKHNYLDLLQDSDFIDFARDSLHFFQNTHVNMSLFDMRGNKFITSTELQTISYTPDHPLELYELFLGMLDRYFLRDFINDKGIDRAFLGQANHTLIPHATVKTKASEIKDASLIVSYIPVIDDKRDNFVIDGVIEISYDISAQWQNILYLEKQVFGTFLAIFSVFFVIVMYNTNSAQKIINQQFEANRDLEEAKMRAEAENTAKTQFLANVSHELRTPLNAIIGFSEIMTAETYGAIGNAQYKDYIQDINNSGKHLLSVINDILDFSKASADKLKVDRVEIDLNKLASSSMRFVKPRADEAKIQLIEQLPKEHVIIIADPKRLKQALLNLLSNSVKFTPENGSVTLVIEKDETTKLVAIKVIDTGIGMSEKDIPKALASFGQVDNKLSRKYEGTGLGLPLTKKLVELMQGKFDLQSEVGKGTTITITFSYEESIVV